MRPRMKTLGIVVRDGHIHSVLHRLNFILLKVAHLRLVTDMVSLSVLEGLRRSIELVDSADALSRLCVISCVIEV